MSQATMQEPATGEKQALIARLHEGEQQFLAALRDVPEDRAKIRPVENSWSVCEVAEHVALAEAGMLKLLLNGAPTDAAPNRERDAIILNALPNRSEKRNAPERSLPTGRFGSVALALAAFKDARKKTLEHLEQASGLRKITTQHPLIGPLDGYQLLLIMALHPGRHAQQVAEIKQSAAYAKA